MTKTFDMAQHTPLIDPIKWHPPDSVRRRQCVRHLCAPPAPLAPLKHLVEVWQVGNLKEGGIFRKGLGREEGGSEGREDDVFYRPAPVGLWRLVLH